MLRTLKRYFYNDLKRVFKTEESRFVLSVGLKVTSISAGITTFSYWYLYRVMKLNYAFFKAHGFPVMLEEPFYEMVIQRAVGNLPVLVGFHVLLLFIGMYVGWLMLRPFKKIGDYCEKVLDNTNAIYEVKQFSAYALLTRFSEFFFEYLREARIKRSLVPNSIPPQYSKIHKPVHDHIFMFHFSLLLICIAIISAVFIIESGTSAFDSMVELATRTLKDSNTTSRFFSEQMFVIDDLVYLTVVLLSVGYIMLGLHLYSKVSGAAFAIFSTMRSFIKGEYSSRVHLVGYNYLRDSTRKLNKYLEYIQNNFGKQESKK